MLSAFGDQHGLEIAPDQLKSSASTLDNMCCPCCDNFLYYFKGTPSARQAIRPPAGLWAWARRNPKGKRWTCRDSRRRRAGVAGSLAAVGRQPGPLP